MSEIGDLNVACETFHGNAIGTKMSQLHVLLNEMKTDFNAHTHSAGSQPPSNSIAASLDAYADTFEFTVCCEAVAAVAGFFTGINSFVNSFKTVYNAHQHSAAGNAPTSSIALSALTLADEARYNLSRACPALGDDGRAFGEFANTIVTLANELRSDFNAHVHPTAMTNTTNSTIAATSIRTIV